MPSSPRRASTSARPSSAGSRFCSGRSAAVSRSCRPVAARRRSAPCDSRIPQRRAAFGALKQAALSFASMRPESSWARDRWAAIGYPRAAGGSGRAAAAPARAAPGRARPPPRLRRLRRGLRSRRWGRRRRARRSVPRRRRARGRRLGRGSAPHGLVPDGRLAGRVGGEPGRGDLGCAQPRRRGRLDVPDRLRVTPMLPIEAIAHLSASKLAARLS